jgi:hypothetical protein
VGRELWWDALPITQRARVVVVNAPHFRLQLAHVHLLVQAGKGFLELLQVNVAAVVFVQAGKLLRDQLQRGFLNRTAPQGSGGGVLWSSSIRQWLGG